MIQNGIEFTLSQEPIFIYGVNKVTHSSNVDANGQYNVTKIENKGKSTPAINAVDIDWNGAKPGIGEDSTNGITTTGELLNNIKEIYNNTNITSNAFGVHAGQKASSTQGGHILIGYDSSKYHNQTPEQARYMKQNLPVELSDLGCAYVHVDISNQISDSAIGSSNIPIYWDGTNFREATNVTGGIDLGSSPIGSASKPIYWTGSEFSQINKISADSHYSPSYNANNDTSLTLQGAVSTSESNITTRLTEGNFINTLTNIGFSIEKSNKWRLWIN